MTIIGSADEFWRVRITRVDTTEDLDFEWRPDVLYREPLVTPVEECNLWHVEAIAVDDREALHVLETFDDREAAEQFAATAREALTELTKSQFEAAYLEPAADSHSSEPDPEQI